MGGEKQKMYQYRRDMYVGEMYLQKDDAVFMRELSR